MKIPGMFVFHKVHRWQAWMFVGPLLFLSLLVLPLHHYTPWSLAWNGTALAGMAFVWWGRGKAFALAILLAAPALFLAKESWLLIWQCVVAGIWLLTWLTSDLVDEEMQGIEQERSRFSDLAEQLKESLGEAEFLAEKAQQRAEEIMEEKRSLTQELTALRPQVAQLSQQEDELRRQLTLVKQVLCAYISEKCTTPDLFPDLTGPEASTPVDALCEALKSQLAQQKETFYSLRHNLFLAETKCVALQREQEERQLYGEREQKWMRELASALDRQVQLEDELEHLYSLSTSLMVEATPGSQER